MGGKDAVIVTAKANLQKAVEDITRGAFGYAGQKCSATSLVYVESGVYEEFCAKLVERVKGIVPDDPRKKETFLNPVINKAAFDKFVNLSQKFKEYGKVATGGHTLERAGYYVEPTVILDARRDSPIVTEELFLPVLCVMKVNSLKEAVDEINKSDYGLTGGIFSEDPAEIRYYFDNIEVGVIYANRERGATTGAMVGSQPFVGWKLSGISGKGTGSYYYLPQFLREQSQTIAH
ncbi:MAG: aldehyde dehydrogenase family protein, partial [Thermoplasmataceae archaeon]